MHDVSPEARRVLMRAPDRREVAAVQAVYFLGTGMLPFVSRRRFESLTGPKLEWWLVLTVGTLVSVIGSVLGLSVWRRRVSDESMILGAASAAALGIIDVVYVARRRISPVYLADGAVEFALLGGWLLSSRPRLALKAADHP
jgi:hypothetical protein